MSSIKINIDHIKSTNQHIKNLSSEIGDLENSISSIRISIDHRVAQKGNIDQRLIQAVKAMNELELKMKRILVFIDESMDQYIEADKTAKSPPLEKEKSIWNQFLDGLTTAYDSTKGFVSGLSDSVVSTVDGLWQVIRHPIKTAKGLVYVVQHPVKTGEAIWQAIKESWNTDVVNGNAESSSHWFGRAFGEAALALVGTKGVDKAVKLTRGTELIKEVGGFKVTYGIKGSEKIVNSTGKCLETRGYRPEPGERKMTRDEWKSIDREKRIEANYPKPIINERNYDLVKSNSNYYTSEGEIIWPPNRGVLGDPETMTLKPGIIIDRFGYEAGTFVSPFGVPYEMRALAPETYLKPYKVYVVKKPIEVQAGKIAPWFDEPGLGIQYELNQSVKKLIEQGIIGRVGK